MCQPDFDKWKNLAEYHFASSQTICNYVQDLNLDLLVVVLNEDVLVLSVPATLKNLKLKKQVVDVSKSLKEPVIARKDVMNQMTNHSKNISHQLKLNRQKILHLQTHDDWNISSIFGLLLNYPVVYWYEKDQDTCLSMLPLNVHVKKVKIESFNSEEYVLYSFSSPCCLNHVLQDDILSWNQSFQNIFEAQNIITSLNFESRTVTLPSVAL